MKKEIQILNDLTSQKVDSNATINMEGEQDTTVDTITQENFCGTVSCNFLPNYPNFSKIGNPLCKGGPEKEKRFFKYQHLQIKGFRIPKYKNCKKLHKCSKEIFTVHMLKRI